MIAAVALFGGPKPVAHQDSKPEPEPAPARQPDPPKKVDAPDVLTVAYRLPNEKNGVESAIFTPDGKSLVTCGTDRRLRVWNAADGRPVSRMEGHTQSVRAMSLLPDGRRLLTASHDRTLKLWDVTRGDCLLTYEGHTAQVVNVAALPDGRRFLSSGSDGTIWLWDLDSGEVLKKYDTAPLPVYGLAVTRDGRRAVAGTWDSKRNAAKAADLPKLTPISVWAFEVETGKKLRELPNDASVPHVRISPDGRFAVFGASNGVTVWDLDSGNVRPFGGLTWRVTGGAFTRDNRYVLGTGGVEGPKPENALAVWDANTGKLVASEVGLPGRGYYVATSPDGKRAATVGANGTAWVWNVPPVMVPPPRDPNLPAPVATLTRPDGTPEDVIFTADGTHVVGAANSSKHLMVWDAATGTEVNRLKLPDTVTGSSALALLPDGLLVSCYGADPVVRVWNVKTGELVRRLTTADGVAGFVSVAATADGRVLATAADRTVRVWEANGDKELARFDIQADGRGIAVTPDGKRFVVGCADRSVRLWDADTRRQVRSTTAKSIAWRISLSPDAKWAAFGSGNDAAAWNLDTDETRDLRGAGNTVDGVAFTRDGKFLLGGSVDRGLYAWEFPSGRSLGKVTEHANALRSVVLSPDGKRVATSSTDNTGVVWQLPAAMAK